MIDLLGLVPAILRVSTPLILAGLGVHVSSRAGVLNIGIEGMMLAGALAGVVISALTQNAWLGLVAALLAGAVLAALLSVAIHLLRADLVLSGIALNMAALAGTTLALFALTGDKGISSSLPSLTLPMVRLPLIDDIPILGPLLSGHNVLTYAGLLAVPLVAILVNRTPLGLAMRAVGENPEAAAATGVPVLRVQVTALLISGLFAGAAGAFLSMGYVSWFSQNMTAGRGFIALAADVMGFGYAWGTMAAALLLGTTEAITLSLQGFGVPSELLQAIPYLVPVLAMVIHARRRKRREAH
ncbi:ABC transporter permease [Kaistia dalseonensis]|uniref:Simple sugar transport system permease protein n=1 Tax=Kaistia dalseonensis TaxID=410840 RepID=A0ABU0H447_9HYPH|nr:ABC transporter permease [Kaistia dalseonensis]MCX5494498.1 ABC transporter permease [Kaistia dalseonensis]MDQ0437077.1 simple sugar transport system permease protein [Kaistia dalseonensis]